MDYLVIGRSVYGEIHVGKIQENNLLKRLIMKFRQYISYSLLAISGIFLLCTVFATNTGLANGLVTGKVLWFHLAMLLLAACSLVAAVLTKSVKPFVFSVADGLVMILAAIVALTYNWQLDPEPEKMLFGGQLVVLWFLIKLYSEPGFFQKDKFFNAANAVLEKEPKVKSTAIREMTTDVKNMLNNIRPDRN